MMSNVTLMHSTTDKCCMNDNDNDIYTKGHD